MAQMKFFDAGAVLLIIGSAVVGPIEPQVVTVPDADEKIAACIGKYMNWPYVQPLGSTIPWPVKQYCEERNPELFKAETTAETCERAMREIGAVKDGAGRWWVKWGGVPSLNDAPVICIPAPSGLRGLP